MGWAIGRWPAGDRSASTPAPGLYPAFTLGVACLAYGIPTLIHGSGFLSVYIAAVVLGNGAIPYAHRCTAGARRTRLAEPDRDVPAARAAGVSLAARAVAEWDWRSHSSSYSLRGRSPSPLPRAFRYPVQEIFYVGWVGLRGAVPIV